MKEVKDESNSAIHRLMALKFVKSLFTLNDRQLVEEIKKNNLFECIKSIIMKIKDRHKYINMLESATLELVNVYAEHVRNIFGIEEFKTIAKDYMDDFDHCKVFLSQMYNFGKRTRYQFLKPFNQI